MPPVKVIVFNDDGILLTPPNILVKVWLADKAILVKLLQPLKASEPILVTLLGIVILVKLLQF